MAHEIILSENVPWGADGQECRLLELRADHQDELIALVQRARAKKWFPWVSPRLRRDGRWGAVLEKGMPDSASFDDALSELELNALFEPAPT